MTMSFLDKITQFRQSLPDNYYFSVKDLIDCIIREKLSEKEAIAYIKDWQALTGAGLKFHEKWLKISNCENIAKYEKEEIEMLEKLLKILV